MDNIFSIFKIEILKMKFSIITACLNSEKTINKLIDSVNCQTYQNIEHIFIDGNSADKTKELIIKNSKYKVFIQQSSSGIYGAMNEGIENSNGDILVFIGSDDFFFNSKVLENVAEKFNDKTDIVYGNIQYYSFRRKKSHWRSFRPGEYYKNAYLKGWHAPHPAFFIKKKSIKFPYDLYKDISADFTFMFFHQEILKLKSIYLNQNLTIVGTGGTSQNFKNIFIGNRNIIKTIKIYYTINSLYFLLRRFIFKIKSTI